MKTQKIPGVSKKCDCFKKINTLVQTFFAAISDFQILMFSLLGGLEPPTFRLTAERASRLRHKLSVDCASRLSVDFLCIVRALFYEKSLFLRALNLLSNHENSENTWRFKEVRLFQKN